MSDKSIYWLVFAILSFPISVSLASVIVEPDMIFSAPYFLPVMLGLFLSMAVWLFIVYLFAEKHGLKKGALFFIITAVPGFGSFVCWCYWLAKLKWKTI